VDEANGLRTRGIEAHPGQEQLARGRRADLLQHVGRDHRRQNTQLRFGKAKDRRLVCDHNVTDRRQAGATAQSGAVNTADHYRRHRVDGEKHLSAGARIADVVGLAGAGYLRHPRRVGARTEDLARAGKHHDTKRGIAVRRSGPVSKFSDDVFVEGVADVGTVQRHILDGTAPLDGEKLIPHLRLIISLDRILQNHSAEE
jgi:hypothetical protein